MRAVDAGPDAVWTVRRTAGPALAVRAAEGAAEAELSGPADQLCPALWNRTAIARVTGDPALAALWRSGPGSGVGQSAPASIRDSTSRCTGRTSPCSAEPFSVRETLTARRSSAHMPRSTRPSFSSRAISRDSAL